MTDEQINKAIAEHLDWEWVTLPVSGSPMGWLDENGEYRLFGLFTEDLNAMHEAETELEYCGNYGEELRRMAECVGPRGGHFVPNSFGVFAIAHLTARQRAEAFLRTVGKWEDGQ